MEQLLAHLFGDYIIQTSWMANNKRKEWIPAIVHAFTYGLPFLFITLNWQTLAVIVLTHLIIDHYDLAKYVIFGRNWVTDPWLEWKDCKKFGAPPQQPDWLAGWLLIIVDNSCHLLLNYLALRYLG